MATLRKLAMFMQDRPFGVNSESGFLLDEVRRMHVSGCFFSRKVWTARASSLLPLDQRLDVNRVTVLVARFKLRTQFPQLEVLDSRHAGRQLISAVHEISGGDARLRVPKVSPMQWLSALERTTSARVIGLRSSTVTLSPNLFLSATFKSTTDLRQSLSQKFPGLLEAPRRMDIEFDSVGGARQVQLLQNASARLEISDDESRSLLRTALAVAVESSQPSR